MKVPFVTDSYRGTIPVNWYPVKDDEKGIILMGRPGLVEFASFTETKQMRAYCVDSGEAYLYLLCGNRACRMNLVGQITQLGSVSNNSGPGWILSNGVQILFVDGAEGYVYTIATGAYAQIADVDFPGAAAATYQDGYGAVVSPNTGQFWISGLYDFTSWTATDYATAEGWPDNLKSILMDHRELVLFGTDTIENWFNSGAADFPFERREGAFLETGLGATGSPAKLDNSIYFMSDKFQIMKMVGYQVQVVSSRKIEREIESYAVKSDAIGMAVPYAGHPFYVLNFPTANKTLVYDVAISAMAQTPVWHRWSSFPDEGRFRGNCYAYFAGKHIFGDYENGKIYYFAPDVYQDDGNHLIAEVDSQEISQEGQRFDIPALQIEFDTGRAVLVEDPQAMLQWSNDGGNTWGNQHWVSMGKIGEYSRRSIWRRNGDAFRRTFRLRISDAVCRNILSVSWIK